MQADPPDHGTPPGPARIGLLVLGWLCTGLAVVGAFLPLLPTTPFLLLAAGCFARSSPALHRRLLEHRVLGPYIAQWQRDHTVPREAKRKAYGLVVLSFGTSIALTKPTWLRLALAALGLALIVLLACLPTTRDDATN
jgi:hypothetical protein